jgi:apolipoprotein N-acyltransferase
MRDLFELLIPQLTDLSMRDEDLTPGVGANVIELEEASIGSLICFDSIYDELARDSVRSGAEILTISTNDSWFVDSAALDMHNAQAKLRAIENRRYVVRAANTGISSMITPTGEVISSLDALEGGELTEEMGCREELTLYTRVGNLFVYLCIAFVCGVLAASTVNKFRKKARLD